MRQKPRVRLSWTARSFLARFPELVFPEDAAAAMRVREAALAAVAREELPDVPSAAIVLYAAAVLAAHRELVAQGAAPAAARTALVESFRQAAGGRWVQWGTRVMLWLMRGRSFVRAMGGERTRRAYGALFAFAEEEDEVHHRHWVLRCGFHDYLRRHGAAELTPIFCAWDALWADEVNRHGRGVRFTRPQTIAEGAGRCLFEFRFEEGATSGR